MPRPVQYQKSDLEELIKDKLEKGIPIKAGCRTRNWPYVSINKALKRYGLSIPKHYAEVKANVARRATNGIQPESNRLAATPPVKAKKTRKPKVEAQATVTTGSQTPE